MIDINKPVKQGQDMILNYADGTQKLGSDSGFEREAKAGKLISSAPNDNPDGDVNPGDSYTGTEPIVVEDTQAPAPEEKTVPKAKPKRDPKGHFVKG